MALYIKDPRAEQLAAELAAALHSNKTRVVIEALEEYARKQSGERANFPVDADKDEAQRMIELARELFGGPVLDSRSADEILGYDEHGLPT